MKSPDPAVVEFVRQAVQSDRYAAYLRDAIMTMVGLNTAPGLPLADTVARERKFMEWLESEVARAAGPVALVERPAINPAIASDEDYSLPGYAADASGRVPPAEMVYAGRHNLLATIPGKSSPSPAVILHAHLDTVPPWMPGRLEGARVYGRGACYNKAQIAVLLAQMMLMR